MLINVLTYCLAFGDLCFDLAPNGELHTSYLVWLNTKKYLMSPCFETASIKECGDNT